MDDPAPGLMGGIHGLLKCGGVVGLAVAFRAKIPH